MTIVAGIFDNKVAADRGLAKLLDVGFTKDDISLLMTSETRNRLFSSTDDEASRVAKGGVAGAVIGGALGALLAGLTTISFMFAPGAGLLAVGPMVGALSGLGAGGVIGGLSGALIRAGFAADEANRYEKELSRGKAVVIVHISDKNKIPLAELALRECGAMKAA